MPNCMKRHPLSSRSMKNSWNWKVEDALVSPKTEPFLALYSFLSIQIIWCDSGIFHEYEHWNRIQLCVHSMLLACIFSDSRHSKLFIACKQTSECSVYQVEVHSMLGAVKHILTLWGEVQQKKRSFGLIKNQREFISYLKRNSAWHERMHIVQTTAKLLVIQLFILSDFCVCSTFCTSM